MDDGDKDGQNELVRIRTRTGHQILMHNSSDLIYISNSKGTSWIELTSNGKIDIYAQDSISVHTENDFNFRADRDINMEAGRNININAGGGIEMNCVDRFYLVCDNNGKIQIGGSLDLSVGEAVRAQAGGLVSLISGAQMSIAAAGGMDQIAGGAWKLQAGGTSNITSGGHKETAPRIDMNGPASELPAKAPAALTPERLVTFSLPNRSASSGWSNGNFYRSQPFQSIMQRVPTHEPWDQHENVNPAEFVPERTNVQVIQPVDKKSNPTGGSGAVPTNGEPIAVPSSKDQAAREQYLQSVLIQGGVTDPIKLASWMAQCKIESANFRALREYASGAEYEGRKDLGNTQPGDGVKFKGRGFIQCTGRDNYKSMSSYFGLDFISTPELVEELEWAAKSVLWFFNVYKKGRTAGVNWDDCTAVTKIVNGGTNALAQRKTAYDAYKIDFINNGIAPKGTVGTGSGGSLVDSSGKPVISGQ
jgi:predicted chitinase